MKIRILPILVVGIMATTAFLSSCLGNDYGDIEYPSESSITSFSIGTLYQTIYKGSSTGKDTIDTVSYASHPFIIDQIHRKIYNPDSLPKGVDITRVPVRLSADYDAVYYVKDGKDTIWTSADSLNFTNSVTFKVMSFSKLQNQFVYGSPYVATINVHKQNPDSMVWNNFENRKFADNINLVEQRAVYREGQIYVFGKDESENIKVNKIDIKNSGNWNAIDVSSISGINIYSATAFNDDIYFVAGRKLYRLGDTSTPIGSVTDITNLISTYDDKILAYKETDNKVIAIDADGNEISGEESSFVEGYKLSERLSAVTTTATHNSSLWRAAVMINNPNTSENDTTALVFSYTSSDSEWIKYQANNPATCPNLKDVTMISYDNKLLAFGGSMGDDHKAFEYFYSSTDNGLTWRKETGYICFPEEFGKEGSYSCVVEDNRYIWFIWKDGSMSRGNINRLTHLRQ